MGLGVFSTARRSATRRICKCRREHIATPSRPGRRHLDRGATPYRRGGRPAQVDGKFILIRQERVAVRGCFGSFRPARSMGRSTTRASTKRRCASWGRRRGCRVRSELIPLGYFFSSVGFTDECGHLFLARDVVPREEGFDHDEHEAILEVGHIFRGRAWRT